MADLAVCDVSPSLNDFEPIHVPDGFRRTVLSKLVAGGSVGLRFVTGKNLPFFGSSFPFLFPGLFSYPYRVLACFNP